MRHGGFCKIGTRVYEKEGGLVPIGDSRTCFADASVVVLNHVGAFISKESDEETARSMIQKHGDDCDAVMADVIRCFRSFDCVCVIEQPPDGQSTHGLAKVLARDDG